MLASSSVKSDAARGKRKAAGAPAGGAQGGGMAKGGWGSGAGKAGGEVRDVTKAGQMDQGWSQVMSLPPLPAVNGAWPNGVFAT